MHSYKKVFFSLFLPCLIIKNKGKTKTKKDTTKINVELWTQPKELTVIKHGIPFEIKYPIHNEKP